MKIILKVLIALAIVAAIMFGDVKNLFAQPVRIFTSDNKFGSGTAISKHLVLTAHHVIEKSEVIMIKHNGGTSHAELFFADKELDYAILYVEDTLTHRRFKPAPYPRAPFTLGLIQIFPEMTDPTAVALHGVVLPAEESDSEDGGNVEHIRTQLPAYPGCSGSLMYNGVGDAIGVVSTVLIYGPGRYPIGITHLVPASAINKTLLMLGYAGID